MLGSKEGEEKKDDTKGSNRHPVHEIGGILRTGAMRDDELVSEAGDGDNGIARNGSISKLIASYVFVSWR